MKIKPLIAYAVVDKERPRIDILSIFETDDVVLDKDEKIIKVIIRPE